MSEYRNELHDNKKWIINLKGGFKVEKKVCYSIVSSTRFSRNEENRSIIEENIKKGENHFLIRNDDYGECFEVHFESQYLKKKMETGYWKRLLILLKDIKLQNLSCGKNMRMILHMIKDLEL